MFFYLIHTEKKQFDWINQTSDVCGKNTQKEYIKIYKYIIFFFNFIVLK